MAAYVTYGRSQRRAGSSRRWTPFALVGLGCVALFGVAACSKLGLGNGGDEMSWARAALERNNRLEVIAADPQTNTFTVRVKDTGELRMIRADQVVGGPPGGGTQEAPASGAAQGASAVSQPAAPAEPAPPPTTTAANSPTNNAASSNAASSEDSDRGGNPPGAAAGPASNAPQAASRSEPAPPADAPNPNSDVATTTPGGRTLASGPGYAIKVASKGATAPARTERSMTSAAVERRHEPIICQGDRLLQIDNRNLEFDGDAIAAEDGCEIHITNSRIIAKGVGVSVRHANVHIDNSQIEGDTASIDSSEGGQVYAASSKFKGLSRRLDNSSFHDLGGNVWN